MSSLSGEGAREGGNVRLVVKSAPGLRSELIASSTCANDGCFRLCYCPHVMCSLGFQNRIGYYASCRLPNLIVQFEPSSKFVHTTRYSMVRNCDSHSGDSSIFSVIERNFFILPLEWNTPQFWRCGGWHHRFEGRRVSGLSSCLENSGIFHDIESQSL